MLESALSAIRSDVNEIYALMHMMASVWNDNVSKAVDENLLSSVVDACNAYVGELEGQLHQLYIIEQELNSLAAQALC